MLSELVEFCLIFPSHMIRQCQQFPDSTATENVSGDGMAAITSEGENVKATR